jgi:regulator of replication initiation timing
MLETANEEQQVHLNRTSAQLHEYLCDWQALRSEVSNLRQENEAIVQENNSLQDEITRSRSGIAKAMTMLDGMIFHHGDALVDSSDTEVPLDERFDERFMVFCSRQTST